MTEDEFGEPAGRESDKIPRDGFGRPILPHPLTGERQSWTRPTTLAGSLSDKYNLNMWSKRMAARGFVARPDLLALVQAATLPDPLDKSADRELDALIKRAEEAGGAGAGANIGTARHEFSRRIDADPDPRSALVPLVPVEHRPYLAAYLDAMEANGLATFHDFIEVMTVTPEIGCAGTFDRLLTGRSKHPMIGDLKTAKLDSIHYAWLEIAIQLGVYAHSTHYWRGGKWHEHVDPIDQGIGIVMHLPNDLPPERARCDLYEVDIARGWDLALMAKQVREVRTPAATRSLSRPLKGAEVVVKVDEIPMDWLVVIARATERADLSDVWRAANAAGQWTPELAAAGQARLREIEG